MLRKIIILLLFLPLFSCIGYNNIKGADISLSQTMGHKNNDNIEKAYLKSSSCVYNILTLFAYGDSSIETAKKKGDIDKIKSVSTNFESFTYYFPIYQKGCTNLIGN